MVDFKYDFAFLIKMIKYVFLPVLAVVILTALIIYIYSRKVKKQDMQRYNYLVEFWTTFLAILIIGSLFAVTVGFAISLSNAIRMYNLIEGHEVIYYLVICSPLIPLLFLVIYIYRMIIVLLSKPKKQKELVSKDEIVPEPSAIVEKKEPEIEEVESIVENDNNEDELFSPIVVTESDVEEVEETPQHEEIEVREFVPIVTPERDTDLEQNTIEEVNEPEELNDDSEEKINMEEIELL